MRIRIISVGKVKEKYLQLGIQEYLKRLGPYARVELVSVPDEPVPDQASQAQEQQVISREGQRVLRLLVPGHYVVALDQRGKEFSSEEFAGFFEGKALRGESNLSFVIGGSLGLAPEVLERADFILSLGRMTFPHQMVPLFLLEQTYRAFKIIRGEPYHK